MKKFLPIVLLIIACVAFNSSCKKDKNGENIIPDYSIAGDTNAYSNKYIQNADTVSYQFYLVLFDDFKITINYNQTDIFGGAQNHYIAKLIMPTNVEFANGGQGLVKRLLPNDSITSQLNWQQVEGEAILLDCAIGPLQNSTVGEWYFNEGYIGIRVFKNNRYYYGWIHLKISAGSSSTGLRLLGWSIYHN